MRLTYTLDYLAVLTNFYGDPALVDPVSWEKQALRIGGFAARLSAQRFQFPPRSHVSVDVPDDPSWLLLP